jgi:hypothetical protein
LAGLAREGVSGGAGLASKLPGSKGSSPSAFSSPRGGVRGANAMAAAAARARGRERAKRRLARYSPCHCE